MLDAFLLHGKTEDNFLLKGTGQIILSQNGKGRACSFCTELLYKRLGTNENSTKLRV